MLKWLKARLNEKGTKGVLVGFVVWAFAIFGIDLTIDQQLYVTEGIALATGIFVGSVKEKTDVQED